MPLLLLEEADSRNPGGGGCCHQITRLSPVGSFCSHGSQPSVCWQRSSCPLRKGEGSTMVSLWGLEFVTRAQEKGNSVLSLHRWGRMGLAVTLTPGRVAESSAYSTVAFSELSSGLRVSHPPTSAASCLQTHLLVKWGRPSLCAFVSGKAGRTASLPGGRQLGLDLD